MKRAIVLALLAVLSTGVLSAQNYNWGIGVRGGVVTTGVSVKYNFDPTHAIEGIVGFTNGTNGYILAEWHVPVIAQGFNFFYGPGIHLGSWKKGGENKFTMGIDGIVGLEYKIPKVPLAVAVDYKPAINFVGQTSPVFIADDFGLTLRVVF